MRYGEPITRSLGIVWRHRYLWLLALLGGSDVGSSFSSGGSGSSGWRGTPPRLRSGAPVFGSPSPDQLWALVAVIALASVLLLVFLVLLFFLSCVTQGALVRAAAEHDAEREFRFGLAWRAGLATFWRVVGLRVLVLVIGLLLLIPLAGLVVAAIVAGTSHHYGGLVIAILGGLVYGAVAIAALVALGIVSILSLRAIVLEQKGVGDGLSRGLSLFRHRLGRALLVWLIQVGISLGAGIAIAFGLLVLALPFVAAGVAAYSSGATGVLGGVIAVGGLLAIAALVLVSAVTGAYFSTYWTLAYRRLETDAAPAWTA